MPDPSYPDPAPLRLLFDEAAPLADDQRSLFLDRVQRDHPDHPELADELRALLRHHVRGDALLDRSPLEAAGLVHPAGSPHESALAHERAEGVFPDGARVGPFTIRRVIAAASSSVVYEAVRSLDASKPDSPASPPLALKVVRAELASVAMIDRFAASAAASTLATLDHPALARTLGVGLLDPDSPVRGGGRRPFMAAELVFGSSLPAFVQARPCTLEEKLRLFSALCAGLAHAHARGVFHLALKPSHILIATPGAAPKIIDLGWAALTREDPRSSPRAGGEAAESPAQADIYALGEVFHYLLTGRAPRPVPNHESLPGFNAALPRAPIIPPSRLVPGLPESLDAIALCALAPDPRRRYHTAAEMSADVQRLLDSPPSLAATPDIPRRPHQRRARTTAIIAILAVALGLAARTAWEHRRNHAPGAPSPVPKTAQSIEQP